MSKPTSSFEETAFTSHISELTGLLTQFSTLLDNEAEAIKTNDADALLENNHAKQSLSDQLNQCGNQIESDLSCFETNLIDFSLNENFRTLTTSTQEIVKNAINLTVECHDKNLANGMSIQILSNINQHALDMLSGKSDKDVKLYGSSGEKTQSGKQNTLGKA